MIRVDQDISFITPSRKSKAQGSHITKMIIVTLAADATTEQGSFLSNK